MADTKKSRGIGDNNPPEELTPPYTPEGNLLPGGIPLTTAFHELVKPLRERSKEIETAAKDKERIAIKSDEKAEKITVFIKQCRALQKKLEDLKKVWQTPYREAQAELLNYVRDDIGRCNVAIAAANKELTNWQNEKRRKAEAKRKAELEAQGKQMTDEDRKEAARAATVSSEYGQSSSLQETPVVKVKDISAVPAEYLLVDEQKVKQRMKEMKKVGNPFEIPGLELSWESKAVVR